MLKADLDTPYVLIDLDKMERNMKRMQAVADAGGVALRPHAKTHKIPAIAHRQLQAGAAGITVAKLGEAEAMADGGITDLLIAYPIVGKSKIERLIALASRARMTVALDSLACAMPISEGAAAAGIKIRVLAEVDSGFGRVGLPPGQHTLELVRGISACEGLEFAGLLTFGGHSYDEDQAGIRRVAEQEGDTLAATAELLRRHGYEPKVLSAGSTPTAPHAARHPGVNEIRPGTYVFGDLMQVALGAHELEDCALTVKATVVSRPDSRRAVIDAGTKVFTSDGGDNPIGTGKGYVAGRPGVTVSWFTEEHGMLELDDAAEQLSVGDTLEIIPVHCCAVMNMTDEVAGVRGELVETIWPVAGRGKVR